MATSHYVPLLMSFDGHETVFVAAISSLNNLT